MNRLSIARFVMAGSALAAPAQPAWAEDPGYALRFDGTSDFVRVASTEAVMGPSWTTTKSVSAWVNPTGGAACTGADANTCDVIVGDRPRTWGISRGTVGGVDRIWVWNYDGSVDRIGIEYSPGEWIQVALVHDGGTLTAFRNGVPVGSAASGATRNSGADTVLHFGGMINSSTRKWMFQGEIDEVRVWSVARTDTEILADLNRSLTGSESGLALYYRMSDGSGLSLTDDSGQGWTGTISDGGGGVPADGPALWVPSGAFGSTGGGGVPNTPPVAEPQSIATDEDTDVGLTLAGSDADGDALTFRIVQAPAKGTLSGTAPDLVYTPDPDVHGSDSFAFVVNDGRVDSASATVLVSIAAVNDTPTAVDDAATAAVDRPVTIAVLLNDTDVDGDVLTISEVGSPSSGVAVIDGNSVVYTPGTGFTGTDSFTYAIADGQGGTASALVTVNVLSTHDPGFSLRFDGASDFVLLGATAQMLPSGWEHTKTVSLWVKPTGAATCTLPGPASCDAIFGDRPRWWGISRGPISGVDRIWVWNFDGALRSIAVPYEPDEWVHIALVHAQGVLSAYRNGVLVGTVASGATQQPPGAPVLQLGGVINNAQRNWTFKGEIDEVQIWTVARSAEDIAREMNEPLAGNEEGLAAYYRMSDGAGDQLTDDSGHGWTGQLRDGGVGVPADGPILWVPSGAFFPQ